MFPGNEEKDGKIFRKENMWTREHGNKALVSLLVNFKSSTRGKAIPLSPFSSRDLRKLVTDNPFSPHSSYIFSCNLVEDDDFIWKN